MSTTIRFARSLAPCLANLRGPSTSLQGTQLLHTTASRQNSALTNILGDGPAPAVQVKSAGEAGIELADGLILPGACVFLAGRVFLWDVPTPNDRWTNWGLEHLEVFDVVVPKPELLLLGTGKSAMLPPPRFREYLSRIGVQIDIMDTRNACSTYNLLAEEGRRVAAALLPIRPHAWERR
ncbi:hypothetical protein RSOLAG22IIIB_03951 [Rhizoctonia solani]|uniref:NADH dehydrogenase [ubiquinone] 1 alpha subcomplex assembly factor 3 n=1 Tax=Rhizoctonia solani TaxID=456999 RepID=A0A0K6FT49_9AGAM|nr:hypothetical protein RSOLAG22IIIB_03951 [Rhizoctonia solani]